MQIISKEALNLKQQMKNLGNVRGLALCGLLTAMYIVMSYFNIVITDTMQIRLGFLVIAAAALYGGPMMGLTVGTLGDILSMILTGGKGSSYFFGFTVSYALMGFLFGLVFHKSKVSIPRAIAGGLVEFIISIFLNTYWLSTMFGIPYISNFLTRLPKSAIMFGINTVLLFVIMNAFHVAIKRAHIITD
ncbi:MAG TPA: folate family ECF transporter S component [Lachnospiraceae bacterium]|nr:folate family ECF transporter S component [Lachnospiraceae bacterium]